MTQPHPTDAPPTRRGPEPPDLAEKGGVKNGQPQRSDRRLFMQLLAFGGCADVRPLANALSGAGVAGVLYEDVNDPRGIALLTFNEDPTFFGAGDYAHDIRLACHGLDKDDNDFIVGLIGKELFPLSAVVQAMRKTQQTALYLERLGPFFVGRAVWQSPA